MTTLYKPVLIETAEQAEALPIGTVALQPWGHGTTARTLTNGRWITPSGSALPHVEAVGSTALVPIEAEEETVEERVLCQKTPDVLRRYITPWVRHTPRGEAV